ncbi:MAG TPA: AMP-dependent synthetase, partial [Candidatus Latescibacteria bacterium]|nr:AMP-dependent synthetase [Candidatus Latescibacterota bacterium]
NGELERLVNRIANGIREHGIEPETPIALYMPMTVECVAAYLGIIRARCVAVSIADSFSAIEVNTRMRIAGARHIITVDHYIRAGKTMTMYDKVLEADVPVAIVIPSKDSTVSLRNDDLLWDVLLSSEVSSPSVAGDPYCPINILFSSGTTGEPKAIPWTHLTPLKNAMDGYYHHDIHADDVVAWPTNIGWMMGPWLIYASLINGATMALYEGAPHTAGFARFVQQAEVSMLGVIPSLVRVWRTGHATEDADWSRIRLFSSTGEPSNRYDQLWLMSRTGYRAPVIEYLGGTEIGGGHLTCTVLQPASPSTFTTPALGSDCVILDEKGQPVDEGH